MYHVLRNIAEDKLEEVLRRSDVEAGLQGIYPGPDKIGTIGYKDSHVSRDRRPIKGQLKTFIIVFDDKTDAEELEVIEDSAAQG